MGLIVRCTRFAILVIAAVTMAKAVRAQGVLAFEPATMSTVVGTGSAGYSGDNGDSTVAQLNSPSGLAFDSANNLYIADAGNDQIRMVQAGYIYTIATNGYTYLGPTWVQIDAQGNLFVDDTQRVIKAPLSTGVPTNYFDVNGEPSALVLDASGNAYFADASSAAIYVIAAGTGSTSLLAGGNAQSASDCNYENGIPALEAAFSAPSSLRTDNGGNVYILDCSTVRVIYRSGAGLANLIAIENPGTSARAGYIYKLAGTGGTGNLGDGQLAMNATFSSPKDMALDPVGDVYVADSGNYAIRKINATTGVITTIIGNHTNGYSGDRGVSTSASLGFITGLALDQSGNILISDASNNVVRQSGGSGLLTFGPQQVGTTSAAEGITITNRGNTTLHFSLPPTPSYGSDFSVVSGNTCGVDDLGAGASCVIYVTFSPTATGTQEGSFVISDDGVDGGHAIAVSGGGTAAVYYDVSIAADGQACGTGSFTQSWLGLYDSGDHQHYIVEPNHMSGSTYTYLVKDNLGTNVEVDACPASYGTLGPGCNGSVYLQRPIIPGVSTLVFWTDKNPQSAHLTGAKVIKVPETTTVTYPDGSGVTYTDTYLDFYYPAPELECYVYAQGQGNFQIGHRF